MFLHFSCRCIKIVFDIFIMKTKRNGIIMDTKKVFRRIGVLTSGGDAPGMNAAVRSVVRGAIIKGVEVMGIYCGYKGLVENEVKLLDARDVSNIINHGGTMLYSDRCLEFKTEAGMQKAIETCKKNGIDGIAAIGGDGTFRGATDLSRRGIPCIGIPGTIDNDISATDYTIGFDTAMNTVIDMCDRLRDTCESHARCNVVEVMGRNAGYIALESGIAIGASGIAIREIPFDYEGTIERIKQLKDAHKRNFIIMVSEGMGSDFSEKLVSDIQEKTSVETKFARLAHVQRGGSPTLRDRLVATQMGHSAVEHLLDGKSNLVICLNKDKICSVEIEYALTFDKMVKGNLKQEELDALDEATRTKMQKEAKDKLDYIQQLYNLALDVSI